MCRCTKGLHSCCKVQEPVCTCSELEPPESSFWLQLNQYDWMPTYKLSDCIWHCLFDPPPDFTVPKASSKVKVVAVLLPPKTRAQTWGRFWSLWKVCQYYKAPKKGSEIRTRFWPRFSHNLAPCPVEFSYVLKFATKRWKTSIGKVTTSCADF